MSCWWLALFPCASAGLGAFESRGGVYWRCSLARWPDESRLSCWWLALFPVALAGRAAFESLVALFPVVSDERRLSRWWLALFFGALAGREVFESLVVGVVLRRVG
ncbi:MAG: hypothetical protein HQL90_15390 [Magnetococcales bacterium]|nr:hypothetical protein [Magnetococcales bacterium]